MISGLAVGSVLSWKVGRRFELGGRIAVAMVAFCAYLALFGWLAPYMNFSTTIDSQSAEVSERLGRYLGPHVDVSEFDQAVLLDVQGLYGGRDLWLSSDGKAVCRFVGQGVPQETRFEFEASREQLARLRNALQKHGFSSIWVPRRDGVPDEAHPKIFIASGSHQVAVAKWDNDKNADFDAVYNILLEIAESGKKGKQLPVDKVDRNQNCDWGWKPSGFPDNQYIRDLAKQ